MKAVILAGGEGARLRPLTCDRPKPMVPVLNIPIMEHIINLLRRHNFKDIAVTLQYLPEQIRHYFRDGRDFGVNLEYYTEDTPLGTAGSVKNAEAFLDETFLVISGDALTDFNLESIMEFHCRKQGIATVVLTRQETPLEYGVVITDAANRIVRFLEKPDWNEVFSDTVNTGIYVLEPRVFRFFDRGVKFDFSKDLFPLLMAEKESLFGLTSPGYWCDIGTLTQYRQAHKDVLDGRVKIEIKKEERAEGVWVGRGVEIEKGARVEGPVFLGDGCRVRKGAVVKDYTVLGNNTLVETDSSLKQTITWKGCYLGKRTELRGSVLCRGVQVNDYSALYEGVVVGDNTIIEESCRIKPNIKIWPAKRVEGGTFLNSSLVWGSRAGNSLFGSDGIGGTVNLELTPEMGAKLGAAYGSLVGEGEAIVLGGDSWHASGMIKEAIAAGLTSAGVRVLDLGQVITPVTRWAVTELKARGGIHVQVFSEEACLSKIKVFDERGFNLTKNWERKIEQAFFREDFRRIRGSDVGVIVKPPDITSLYFNKIAASVNKESFREHSFRLLWLYPSPYLYTNFMPLLRELYCQVITLSPPDGKIKSLAELAGSKESILETMKVTRSQAAFYMDDNAESLAFFDERGSLVAEEMFTLFISLLLFQKGKGGRVAVPVTTPSAVDKLAGLYEGEVFRTKTSPAVLMEEVEPSQFLLSFDALSSFVYILEYAALKRSSLGELVEMIPAYYLRKKMIPCAWKDKGRVMRRLIEETGNARVELLDGIKVHYPEGWALVLPDPEKPYYQVYSEGYSAEVADSLTDMYIKKIEDIKKQET